MDSKKMKSIGLLGTYFIGLVLILIKFDAILGIVIGLLSTFKPLFIGIAIAFVLDKLCNQYTKWFYKLFHFSDNTEGGAMGDDNLSGQPKSNKRRKIYIVNRYKTIRGISIGLTYLTVVFLIAGIFWIAIPQLVQSMQTLNVNVSSYFDNLEKWINDLADKYHLGNLDFSILSSFDSMIKEYVDKILKTLTGMMPQIMKTTGNIVSVLTTIFLSIIMSIYILISKKSLIKHVKRMSKAYLSKTMFDRIEHIMFLISDIFGKYIVGQLTEAVILGGLCFIGMVIFRFEYAPLISSLIAITALIPVVGAYLGGGVAAFLLFIISPMKALWFLIYLIILQQLEGNIIYPKVVGGSIGLPALWVLLSILVGGSLFGVVGMLIGVPTFAVIYNLLKEDIRSKEGRKG